MDGETRPATRRPAPSQDAIWVLLSRIPCAQYKTMTLAAGDLQCAQVLRTDGAMSDSLACLAPLQARSGAALGVRALGASPGSGCRVCVCQADAGPVGCSASTGQGAGSRCAGIRETSGRLCPGFTAGRASHQVVRGLSRGQIFHLICAPNSSRLPFSAIFHSSGCIAATSRPFHSSFPQPLQRCACLPWRNLLPTRM